MAHSQRQRIEPQRHREHREEENRVERSEERGGQTAAFGPIPLLSSILYPLFSLLFFLFSVLSVSLWFKLFSFLLWESVHPARGPFCVYSPGTSQPLRYSRRTK